MREKVKLTHLRAIKGRLLGMKENIDGIDYWDKENELGALGVEKDDLKKNYRIIQRYLDYLSDKF